MNRQELVNTTLANYWTVRTQLNIQVEDLKQYLNQKSGLARAFSPVTRELLEAKQKDLDALDLCIELLTAEQKRLDSGVKLTDETAN